MTDVVVFDLPAPEGVRLTARSLEVLDPSLPLERFEELLRSAGEVKTALSFVIGDLLNFGEARYGERYAQAVNATGLTYSTLSNYAYVCRQVAPSRRREGIERWSRLRFSHFAEVAALEPADQERWLDRSQESGWTRDELRQEIQAAGQLPPRTREPKPRQEVLAAPAAGSVVDAARGLSEVRETLSTLSGSLEEETAETIGLPRAMQTLDDVSATVKMVAETLARPALVDAARRAVSQATRSSGFAMVPIEVWEDFAAAVAAEE